MSSLARLRLITKKLPRQLAARFPAVVLLSSVATAAGVVLTVTPPLGGDAIDAIGLLFDYTGSFEQPLADFLSNLLVSCITAMPVAVAAQCALERQGRTSRRMRMTQLIAGVAACALVLAISYASSWAGKDELWLLVRTGIVASSSCACTYLLMNGDNEDTLVPRLLIAALFAWLVCLLLCVGMGIICLTVDYLLGFEDLAGRVCEVSLVGCWLMLFPNLLAAQLPLACDPQVHSRAWNHIVGYVVLPLCIILLGVLYAYVLRIAVVREMPVGEMNWFGCFALLVFVFLMLCVRDHDSLLARWFVRWGWASMIPVVCVQVVGLFIRVRAYGLTTLRYASCLWIAFGLATMLQAALGRKRVPVRSIVAVAGLCAIVAFISPANLFDVPNLTQDARLRSSLEVAQRDGSQETVRDARTRVASAWEYLMSSDDGYFSLPEVDELRHRFEQGASFKELFGFEYPVAQEAREGVGEDERTWWIVEYSQDANALDVAGFARVYALHDAAESNKAELDAGAHTQLSALWEDGTSVEVDLAEAMDALAQAHPGVLEHAPSESDYSYEVPVDQQMLRIDAGEGRVLVLKRLKRTVDVADADEDDVEVWGYLLVP